MIDLTGLQRDIDRHGPVARVVIAQVKGSAPREAGAAMHIWRGGQSGTIGGGSLELKATQTAFDGAKVQRLSLGPDMGQCCGGAVVLVTETFDQAPDETDVFARRITGPNDMPLAVARLLAQSRSSGAPVGCQWIDGWLVEDVAKPTIDVWVWGAGHVGRAIVATVSPLPNYAITWIDSGFERFPPDPADHVTILPAPKIATAVDQAPKEARHLIVTYSHAIDLDLCHRLLTHGFFSCGLIGSKTKWARFRSRLLDLGHSRASVDRILCPIGNPILGKHPHAIAVGVCAAILSQDIQGGAAHRANAIIGS